MAKYKKKQKCQHKNKTQCSNNLILTRSNFEFINPLIKRLKEKFIIKDLSKVHYFYFLD